MTALLLIIDLWLRNIPSNESWAVVFPGSFFGFLLFNGGSIIEGARDFYNDVVLGRTGVTSELSDKCSDALAHFSREENVKVLLVNATRRVVEGQFLPLGRDINVTVQKDGLTVGANNYARAGVDRGLVRAVDVDGREITVSMSSRVSVLGESRSPASRELSIDMNCLGVSKEAEKFFRSLNRR